VRSLSSSAQVQDVGYQCSYSARCAHRVPVKASESADLPASSPKHAIAIARLGLAISVFTLNAVPTDFYIQGTFLSRLPHMGVLVTFVDREQTAIVRAFGEHIHRLLPQLGAKRSEPTTFGFRLPLTQAAMTGIQRITTQLAPETLCLAPPAPGRPRAAVCRRRQPSAGHAQDV
jgi:hypothetical protein